MKVYKDQYEQIIEVDIVLTCPLCCGKKVSYSLCLTPLQPLANHTGVSSGAEVMLIDLHTSPAFIYITSPSK